MADISVSTFFNRCYVSDAKPKFFLPHQSLKIIASFQNLTKTNLTLSKRDFYLVSLAVDNRIHYLSFSTCSHDSGKEGLNEAQITLFRIVEG